VVECVLGALHGEEQREWQRGRTDLYSGPSPTFSPSYRSIAHPRIQHQAQQQIARATNRGVPTSMTPGSLPPRANLPLRGPPQLSNGINPAAGALPNGAGPFPPSGQPQPNGIGAASGALGQPGLNAHNFPRNGSLGGRPGQPNGTTYPSPTMAHSPQGAGGPGPSPLATRGMPPPGALGPAPGFGRPPSRSQTPGGSQASQQGVPPNGGMMTQPSPSMGARQIPGAPPMPAMSPQEIHQTLAAIPLAAHQQMKQEAGVPVEKEMNSMTMDEKVRRL
jgi:hypothetical protein